MVKLVVFIFIITCAQFSMAAVDPKCSKHLKLVTSANEKKIIAEYTENVILDKVADSRKVDYTTSLEIFRLAQGLTDQSVFQINLKPNVSSLDFMKELNNLGISEARLKPGEGIILMTIDASQIGLLMSASELDSVQFVELYLRKF